MKAPLSRKPVWPRIITLGRIHVSVYKRTAPNGATGYMVANYATGKRRFDSYPTEAEALDAAAALARKMSERDTIGATMTKEQALDYAAAIQSLNGTGLTLSAAVAAIVEAVKQVGDLPNVAAAIRFYKTRHKSVTPKTTAEAVAELLAVKTARGGSGRYIQDLRSRLTQFADVFKKNIGDITTAEIQSWLDGQKTLAPQTHVNFRRVIHLLFKFAVARGYALDNQVDGVERVKIRNTGNIEIFTPEEIRLLLTAASDDFLPSLAIGAFAGLRSAEIERLTWEDIDLTSRHIVIGAGKAKTASRRIVPISDNLAAWLTLTTERKGKVWKGTHDAFYEAQQETANKADLTSRANLTWKANGLRHSCASYMFALSNDAGRVAGVLGNSASVIHRHYRELVKPTAAQIYFSIKPTLALPEQPPKEATSYVPKY